MIYEQRDPVLFWLQEAAESWAITLMVKQGSNIWNKQCPQFNHSVRLKALNMEWGTTNPKQSYIRSD